MSNEKRKVTLYFKGEFLGNIIKYEVYLIDYGTQKYAQYDSAPYVSFMKPRGRTVLGMQQSYKPSLIILEGWGHQVA